MLFKNQYYMLNTVLFIVATTDMRFSESNQNLFDDVYGYIILKIAIPVLELLHMNQDMSDDANGVIAISKTNS